MADKDLLRTDSLNAKQKTTFQSNPTGGSYTPEARGTRVSSTAALDADPKENARLSPKQPLRLVLLSDDDAFCSLLKAYLQHLGFWILTCTNSDRAEALFLTRDDIDLWLIDTQALGMEGAYIEVKVRQLHPRVPIVLIAGSSANQNMLQRFFWEGWLRIEKPADLPNLLSVIQLALADPLFEDEERLAAGNSSSRFEDEWMTEEVPDWDLWRNRN